jgi:hypothetical protein
MGRKTKKQLAKEEITLKQDQKQASLFFKPTASVSVPRALSPKRRPLQDISPNANRTLKVNLESSPFKVFLFFNCSLIYI